jgi:ribosomal protein L7/L12
MAHEKTRALPTAAAMALNEGRKLEAIKIVREAEGCDLAAAVARVNAALDADPVAKARLDSAARAKRGSLIVWIVLIDTLLVVAAIYWYLNKRN